MVDAGPEVVVALVTVVDVTGLRGVVASDLPSLSLVVVIITSDFCFVDDPTMVSHPLQVRSHLTPTRSHKPLVKIL